MSAKNTWPTVALDAGHGLYTYGKQTPDGIKEWFLNDKVRDYTVEYLTPYKVNIVFPDNDEGRIDESLTSRRTMYIAQDVDLAVSFHHNAFTGKWGKATGVEVWVDRNCTAADMEIAKLVYARLPKYTGLKGRGIKDENWAVINQNKIPAILVEGGFMDSKKDYKVITSEEGQRAYAKALAEAIVIFLDLKKKSPSKNPTTNASSNKDITVKFKMEMNVRKGAGVDKKKALNKSGKVIKCLTGYKYTIVKTKKVDGVLWGKLKSGVGWVCIDDDYCKRV